MREGMLLGSRRRWALRLLAAVLAVMAFAAPRGDLPTAAQPLRSALGADPISTLSIAFEPNRGQAPSGIRFLARGPGYTLTLSATEATLAPVNASPTVQMRYMGAELPHIVGMNRLPGHVSYLLGRNPKNWHRDIPTFARVEYRNLYPGIDLAFRGAAEMPEYDWIVHPGADLSRVALSIRGAGTLGVDRNGNLTGGGDVLQHAPVLYQVMGGKRQRVAGGFAVEHGTTVRFVAGHFDRARSLVVDPTLVYSDRVGGGNGEGGYSLAVDRAGNTYVTGDTASTNFPVVAPVEGGLHTAGPCQRDAIPTCVDAFVLKLSSGGNKLLYSTFIGGQGDDYGHGVAVDRTGNVYVTGSTDSTDFPVSHAGQSQFAGGRGDGDAYLLKLNGAGTNIVFSTYLGGSGNDDAQALRLSGGKLYLAGSTSSANFPIVHGWQTSLAGHADAFVARFTRGGTLTYSTYLGGTETDGALGIAIRAGKIFVAGSTGSADFPTVHSIRPFGGGSCDEAPEGICPDAFVTAFPLSGGKPLYSTLLGGKREDAADAVTADAAGNAYVVGGTYSRNFPLVRPLRRTLVQDDSSGFVAKINPTGTALIFSTYLGGTSLDEAYGVAVDEARNVFVTGTTVSDDFPVQDAIQPTIASSGPDDIFSVQNAFISVLAPGGGSLLYSTYLGGVGQDLGADIVVDGKGNAYVTGFMTSKNFPRTSGSFHSAGGQYDTFIAKIHSVPIARTEKEARVRKSGAQR